MTLVECHPPTHTASLDGLAVRFEWTFVATPPGRAGATEGRLVLTALCSDGAARVSAWSDLGDSRCSLLSDLAAAATLSKVNGHVHLELAAALPARPAAEAESTPPPILSAVLDAERAVYVRSDLPRLAGLPGGTYDLVVTQLRPAR